MQSATATLEIALIARAQAGDAAAIEALVVTQMPLIKRFANRYRKISGRNISPLTHEEDLIQEGVIGLMGAINAFDPSRGVKLGTFARKWIKGAILESASREGQLLKVPEDARLDNWKITGTADTLEGKLGRPPTDAEIAAESGLTERRVHLYRNIPQRYDFPSDEDEDPTLIDDQTPYLLAAQADGAKFLDGLFSVLTPDEMEMVSMRFGLDGSDPLSMAEVGRRMGRKDVKTRIPYALIKMRRAARRMP
jgi:RNA polymerase sigma factor (sigma-70 family)